MKAKNRMTTCALCLLAALALYAPARAQWTEPVRLTEGISLTNPRAVTVSDTIHIVTNGSVDIYYMRSNDNGLTWTEPAIPVADTFDGSQMPDIIYSNGYIHIVCVLYFLYQGERPFHFSSSNGGRTWSAAYQIHDEGLKYPRLACSGDTLFVSFIGEEDLLVSSSFNNGETWNEPFRADYRHGIFNSPCITYSEGRINLVYQLGVHEDTTGLEIYHRYSDDLGATWSDRYCLSIPEHWQEGKIGQVPSAYADSSGNLIALWMDYKYGSACGISGDILGRVSRDNGETWLPETRLTYTQTGRKSSCLILNDRLYAVWDDYFTFYCQKTKVTYSESTDWGITWSVPEVISGPAERSEHRPVLIYNISGNDTIFHVVMAVYDPPNSGLFYFRNQEFTNINEQNNTSLPQDILLGAYPNPFNSSTVISYANLGGGEIEIFNINGQLIRTFILENRKEGKVTWDATDATCETVCSGIYFARVRTPQGLQTLKLVYLK